MGRPLQKITINDYQRGLTFEITDRATIAGLNSRGGGSGSKWS